MINTVGRDRRYETRQKEIGRVKVCVWVPEDMAERLKKYAARLRKAGEG